MDLCSVRSDVEAVTVFSNEERTVKKLLPLLAMSCG